MLKETKIDKTLLRYCRDLCPSGKSGITSIEISTKVDGKEKKVILTKETRKKINKILKTFSD